MLVTKCKWLVVLASATLAAQAQAQTQTPTPQTTTPQTTQTPETPAPSTSPSTSPSAPTTPATPPPPTPSTTPAAPSTSESPSAKSEAPTGTENCRESAQRVEFKKGSDLPSGEKKKLDEVATWLSGDPQRTVVVKATTDQSGSAKFNEDLSFRRAESVATELASMGVSPARVIAVGEGEAPTGEGLSPAQQRSARILLCQAPEPTPPPSAAATPAPAPAPEPTPPPAAEAPPEGPIAQASPSEPMPTTPYQEVAPLREAAPERPSGLGGIGLGFALGGGVIDFTDKQSRALTGTGGSWDARVIFGTRLPLALELAYVGSAQGMNDIAGISTNSYLVGNGGEGDLRIQLPTFFVRPYIFGGLGWMHYSLVNTNGNNSVLASSDDLLTVPMGTGIMARAVFGGTLDIRGTFRLQYRETMFDGYYSGTGEHADFHTWNVTARLGWDF
jgi:outer membrane protein OmpA-like peptidoglycan-associated protein